MQQQGQKQSHSTELQESRLPFSGKLTDKTMAEDLLSNQNAKVPILQYVGLEVNDNIESKNFNERKNIIIISLKALSHEEVEGLLPVTSSSLSNRSFIFNTLSD